MYLLAHTGITLGLTELALAVQRRRAVLAPAGAEADTEGHTAATSMPGRLPASFGSPHLFYLVILFGALLPDAIDKPLGMIFFGGYFSSGRTLGHTLLFLLVVLLGGIVLYRKWGSALGLVLAAILPLHYIMDGVWDEPLTLWWPLLGWSFGGGHDSISEWVGGWFYQLFYDPSYYLPELIGLAVLLWWLFARIIIPYRASLVARKIS